jgi:hypothetical protein
MRGLPASWLEAQMGTMRLGEILLDHGVIRADDLAEALARQSSSGRKLGELLIDLGMATPVQIQAALEEQRRMEIS